MTDPVDSVKTSIITYDNFTEFQHRLHSPNTNDEIIPSYYFVEIRKTSRGVYVTSPLVRTSESNLYVYTANSKFDYLLNTYLATTLPSVRVKENLKDRVQICWTKNPCHNIIKRGQLRFDGDTCAEIPGGWLDIKSQFFMKEGARFDKHYDYIIGNVGCLVNWGNYLPKFEIASPQPWYYAEALSNAIPLFLCSLNGVDHVYDFRLNLEDLIRMRFKEKNGQWRYIKYNPNHVETSQKYIDPPIMIGEYSRISPEEKKWHIEEIPHEVVATNVMHFGTINAKPSGDQNVSIKIHTTTPVKCLFFLAECQEARELNNRSNYTTNPHDSSSGFNPIRRITHVYNSKPALVEEGYQVDRMQIWYHSQSAPGEMGYNMHSHSYKPGKLRPDIGLTYTQKLGVELLFSIDSGNPLASDHALDESSKIDDIDALLEKDVIRSTSEKVGKDKSFYVHAYALTYNILKFSTKGRGKVEIDSGTTDTSENDLYDNRNGSI